MMAPSDICSTFPTTFGREGGVYAASAMAGLTNAMLSVGGGQYIGFSLGVTNQQLGGRRTVAGAAERPEGGKLPTFNVDKFVCKQPCGQLMH
ncbi:MAG: hypothetical protein K2X55_13040 [Burkholderiaceae bacterium]|nr:hypothetical protein [Burkholderiaceae bacterium]